MSFNALLLDRGRPPAILVFFVHVVVLLCSFTESAALEDVAGSATEGLLAAGAEPTTEADAALSARSGGRAATASVQIAAALTSKDADSTKATAAKESATPMSNFLYATSWNSAVKRPVGDYGAGRGGGTAAANNELSREAGVHEKRDGALPDFEDDGGAAEGRSVKKWFLESFAAKALNTGSQPFSGLTGIPGVRDAFPEAPKRASSARRAATAAANAPAEMPGQGGVAGSTRGNLQGAGRAASGSYEAAVGERAQGVEAEAAATVGPAQLPLSAPAGKLRQPKVNAESSAGYQGPAREPVAQAEERNLKHITARAAEPSRTAALATKESQGVENNADYKYETEASNHVQNENEPGVVGRQKPVTRRQQNDNIDVGTEAAQKQDKSIEGGLQRREDSIQQDVSPLPFADRTRTGATTCRDWRRNGPHRWLLESPFFKESVTVPARLELVLRLLPFLFYSVDEDGDVVMYLQLCAINVGVARTLLSDEVLRAVFRFRFFVVFGWLAPAPDARAKVFIDAREFNVADALLHGGISLGAAFVKSFASTMGQTPTTAASSTRGDYSAYTYGSSSAPSRSIQGNSGNDSVTTWLDAASNHSNSRAETDPDNISNCHSKHHSGSRSPSGSVNTSTRLTNSSSSEGVDRLREVHVLEAPLGSAVFFRVAQAIVGVRMPLHFYSSAAEFLRSRFAVMTRIKNALMPNLRRVHHAGTQLETGPLRQQKNNAYALGRSSSPHYYRPGPPGSIGRRRRNPNHDGGDSSDPRDAVVLQNESSFSSDETFALEECFAEYVAYLRSNALSNGSHALSRR